MSTTSPSDHNNGKKSMLRGLFTIREPSAQALQQYEKQLKKRQKSRGVTKKMGAGLPMTSSARLPAHVPKVNSKWDGMPCATSGPDHMSKSWSNLAFSLKSTSSQSSAFSRDRHLRQLMKGDGLSSRSSTKSIDDVNFNAPSVSSLQATNGYQNSRTDGSQDKGQDGLQLACKISPFQNDNTMNQSSSPTKVGRRGRDFRQDDFDREDIFTDAHHDHNQTNDDRSRNHSETARNARSAAKEMGNINHAYLNNPKDKMQKEKAFGKLKNRLESKRLRSMNKD